ncbi:MAG: hypothetical protein CVU31_18735 [Betaproteobacteria bacterium HGW-Betaproteobacteria-4]|nr:MAG: hypothetical protein CVU31_18735 [Betaproteobacteria bacterium HGW-Betaproteobacteria-4]
MTGFNNWGKTTHIYNIFGRSRFYMGCTYAIPGVNGAFTVESHSNDDFGEVNFVQAVKNRIAKAPSYEKDIFCAFCPTRENHNDSQRILEGKPFSSFDEIHILLLKYKWDFHAELRIQEIRSYLSSVANAQFFVIDADARQTSDTARCQARDQQIVSYLKRLYP